LLRLYSESTVEEIESQVVDEFADILARPSGWWDNPDPSTLNRHIRGGRGSDVPYIVDGVNITNPIVGGAGIISGLVTDEDGQPVNGALVVVTGASLSATTNADGYYYIQQVPVGTFDVEASRVGCGEQVKSGVKVVAGLRTNLSFQLR
jgi:hypothetical protein